MTANEPKLRVLIVDDNRDGADALGLVVEAFGHQVHVTYGGTQALDVASAFRPDLMLIDLAMPDIDGCVLANRFRQTPLFARTTMVAITGHADEGHRTLATKGGSMRFSPSQSLLGTLRESWTESRSSLLASRQSPEVKVELPERIPG